MRIRVANGARVLAVAGIVSSVVAMSGGALVSSSPKAASVLLALAPAVMLGGNVVVALGGDRKT